MSFNIKDVLPEPTIFAYTNMLNSITQKNKELLLRLLLEIKNYGVDSFAYRQIDKNGNSSIFSTHAKWEILNNDQQFQQLMREHVNDELIQIKQNSFSYVTRSNDKVNNRYLKILNEFDLNNSIIKHKFYEDKIEIIYFMTKDANQRDIILNNLNNLNSMLDIASNLLEYISGSQDFINRKQPLLSLNGINYIWDQNSLHKKHKNRFDIDYNGRNIALTTNEIKCLMLCGQCISNKAIAKKLDISHFTVKEYIAKLKQKFQVINRDRLIDITRQNNMKHFNILIK